MTSGLLYGKNLVQFHFSNFLIHSWNFCLCNRLKYVFELIVAIAAIENIYFAKKINKSIKFYFIFHDLVHSSTVSLNRSQHQDCGYKILKEHMFSDLLAGWSS